MDYPKYTVSNQIEESINIQKVRCRVPRIPIALKSKSFNLLSIDIST